MTPDERREIPGSVDGQSTGSPPELPAEALRQRCDPAKLGFKTTDELPHLHNFIGQPRVLRALELGNAVTGPGYNIFASGLPGSGKTHLIREYFGREAASKAKPDDWCYVNNFSNPRQPKALRLPAGRATELRKDIQALIDRCEKDIPQAFESEEYDQEQKRLTEDLKKSQEAEFSRLTKMAADANFVIARGSSGFVLMPAADGKPLKPEEVEKLSGEQLAELNRAEAALDGQVQEGIDHLRDLQKAIHERLRELGTRTALFVVEHLIEKVKIKYSELEAVVAHLEALKIDIASNASQFHPSEDSSESEDGSVDPNWLRRYDVNVIIDNSNTQGAPVIVENQPSYYNLLGRIEHEVVMTGSQTDFSMIRAGAVHRANGGYLILPARDVLIEAYTWQGLKRVLRDGSIRIVELATESGLVSTATLEPEPIPLTLKVVLIGTPGLYAQLSAYDEDFAKLFKVKAEFGTLFGRDSDTEHEYALFVKSVVDDNQLPPFDNTAVASIIEYGSRLAEEQSKLTTRFGKIADLIREASYWAGKQNQSVISAAAVTKAIEESSYRNNLLEERLQEFTAEDTLMIDVTGSVIGQINALSVMMLGDYSFGRPVRVTSAVGPGRGGIVDIERKSALGGPIHTKGMLIISGFLRQRYGQERPLSLSASVAFEQSYDGIEGDSASAAELLALLSAIGGIPLRQDRAITGSVNQHGQIQAIGGINEKIEGFFAICKLKGLTEAQGVIVPKANVRHLMLREEVTQAVAAGQFHIWPITTVDEGLALLTNQEPGSPGADDKYPKGTLNQIIADQLTHFAFTVDPLVRKAQKGSKSNAKSPLARRDKPAS